MTKQAREFLTAWRRLAVPIAFLAAAAFVPLLGRRGPSANPQDITGLRLLGAPLAAAAIMPATWAWVALVRKLPWLDSRAGFVVAAAAAPWSVSSVSWPRVSRSSSCFGCWRLFRQLPSCMRTRASYSGSYCHGSWWLRCGPTTCGVRLLPPPLLQTRPLPFDKRLPTHGAVGCGALDRPSLGPGLDAPSARVGGQAVGARPPLMREPLSVSQRRPVPGAAVLHTLHTGGAGPRRLASPRASAGPVPDSSCLKYTKASPHAGCTAVRAQPASSSGP
jgi:hypothetical protein